MAVTADKVVVELELKDGQYLAKVRKAGDEFAKSQERMGKAAQTTERQIKASSGAISSALTRMAGSIAAAASVGAIIKMGDAYTNLQNRLKAAGLEGQELVKIEGQLYEAANKNGVAVDAVASLYQRASLAQKSLGASNQEIIDLTNGVSAALRVQGVSAAQASGPLLQLGQALGAGTVRAEELNSLLEGTPILIQAAANGSTKFAGDMNKLAAAIRDGEVSSQEFFAALQKGLPAIEKQASALPKTVGQAMQTLNNQLGRYVGQADQSLSATARLAQGIDTLAKNLDTVIPAVTVLAGAFGLRWAASMAAAGIASDGFAVKTWNAASQAIAAEKAKTAAVAVESRTRTMLLNAEVVALQRQVATGRNAQGQFINMAAAQAQLNSSTRALAGSMPAATLATVRNTTAMAVATTGARALGGGLLALAGGPLGAAVLAIGAMTYALVKLTEKGRDYGSANKEATTATNTLKTSVDAYKEAADAAAIATGEGAKQSREAAKAARDQAVAERDAAAALLTKARATIAAINAQALEQAQFDRFNIRGDRPGSVQTVGQDAQYDTAMANAKTLQDQINAANDIIKEADASLSRTVTAAVTATSDGAKGASASAAKAAKDVEGSAKATYEAFQRIEESLLSDAERAARLLAEETKIINDILASGLISQQKAGELRGGVAARDLKIAEKQDLEPLARSAIQPFEDFAKELQREQEHTAGMMARTFTDILASGNIGEAIGNEFKRAAFNGLELIMKQLLMAALPQEAGRGFLGQIFGFGGNRASGGGVKAGSSYTVGENGRETFVPTQNGYIIPNQKNVNGGGAGMGGVVKLVVEEGSMFSARVEQISGPIAVQAATASVSYSSDQMRTQRRRSSQSFR